MSAKRYAAIDIGTVTCRLLLADVDEYGLHELRREVAITNLGEGVDASGVLRSEAMARVADQMRRFLNIIREYSKADGVAIKVIALATSASRDAKNSEVFISMLAELGVVLTIIPGEREAALSFLGASSDFAGEDLLVVDIGGGSTEIIAGAGGKEPVFKHSFNIGCRRVTERFFASDPPTADELALAKQWTRENMAEKYTELIATGCKPSRLVAVAGTATSVVSIRERMVVYDTTRVHKSIVSADEFEDVYLLLRQAPLEQRKHIVGLDPGRASVIVAGMLIMETVMELAKKNEFTVSETDILQGIILDDARNR